MQQLIHIARGAAGAAMVGLKALAILALCAGTTGAQAEDAAAGRKLVERLCAGCHAIAAGGPSRHPDAPPFPVVAKRYPPDDLAEALAEGIAVRHNQIAMPEFAFDPDEVDDIIAYLKSLR